MKKVTRVFQKTGQRIGKLLGKTTVDEIRKPVVIHTIGIKIANTSNNSACNVTG